MLLHGWGANSSLMLPIARGIKRRSIIPDLYGFGATPHGEKPLAIEDYVRGVLEITEKENIERFDLIGHSFGGRISIMIASLFPEKVNKLVLCDSAGIKPRRNLKFWFKKINYKFRKKLGLSTLNCGSSDYRALSGAMKKTFVNVVNFDQTKQSTCVFTPTLLIWGSKDKDTPLYMAKKLKKNIKNSKLFVIKDAGHFSYAENPKEFLRIVNGFLKE